MKYFYYEIHFRDDTGVWDIKDVTFAKDKEMVKEEITEDLNSNFNPTLAKVVEIPKSEFIVLAKYL